MRQRYQKTLCGFAAQGELLIRDGHKLPGKWDRELALCPCCRNGGNRRSHDNLGRLSQGCRRRLCFNRGLALPGLRRIDWTLESRVQIRPKFHNRRRIIVNANQEPAYLKVIARIETRLAYALAVHAHAVLAEQIDDP